MSRSSLFFFDFDDTLYSHKIKVMPDSTRRALCLLRERGHQVVIASGRGREAFSLFQKELPYMPEVLILMNGQLVYRGDELIMEQHILMDDLDRLFAMAREQKIACGGYYWDSVIADRFNERVETVWRENPEELNGVWRPFRFPGRIPMLLATALMMWICWRRRGMGSPWAMPRRC